MSELAIERLTAGRISEADFRGLCALHHAAFPRPGRTLADVMAKKWPMWMEGRWTGPEAPTRYVVRGPGGPGGPGGIPAGIPAASQGLSGGVGGDSGGEVRFLANAGTLTRTVRTAAGDLTVLGLLDVATAPEARGCGLGERLTRAAFAPVDAGRYPFCLFQTGVAQSFYARMGAAVATNHFIDSTHPGVPPFTDTYVMVYPGLRDWPAGEVDLRGPGW